MVPLPVHCAVDREGPPKDKLKLRERRPCVRREVLAKSGCDILDAIVDLD
jgi:hypothetical protein